MLGAEGEREEREGGRGGEGSSHMNITWREFLFTWDKMILHFTGGGQGLGIMVKDKHRHYGSSMDQRIVLTCNKCTDNR